MALIAYNLTGSPVTLAASNTPVILPASSSPPARGPAVNVTSELRGLTNLNYTALQAQVAGLSVEFVWTDQAEYTTTGLTVQTAATGSASSARTLTAGTGLTGGGDLTADRTFNVVANADGSIIANANDIQVGVLATDGQHGNRGGGALHANVVAAGASGFMTGADKAKLDGFGTSIGATTNTTDATPTVIAIIGAASGKTTIIEAIFWGVKDDFTQGAGYKRVATFRNNGGTVSQVGATSAISTMEDDAAWDVDFNISGTDLQLRVIGKAATNVAWGCRYTYENA